MPDPSLPQASPKTPSLGGVAARIAARLPNLAPGDLADLRRHRHGEPPPMAFWRLAAAHLQDVLPAGGPWRDEAEQRWATAMAALAQLVLRASDGHSDSLHNPKLPLGAALADTGLSELRFDRLMRAEGASLHAQVRQAAAYLAAKGQPANGVDLVLLLLFQDAAAAKLRLHIARSYFNRLFNIEKDRKGA